MSLNRGPVEQKLVIELEGMAMLGLLRRVELVPCDKPPEWKKIRALDKDGRVYETKCMEAKSAGRNFMVFNIYLRRWARYIFHESA